MGRRLFWTCLCWFSDSERLIDATQKSHRSTSYSFSRTSISSFLVEGSMRSDIQIPLPKDWPNRIRSGVIQVISLAHFSLTFARSVAANSINARVRLKAENNRLRQEIAILIEAARIKDSRMERIPAQRRPHYPPIERMAILELRAARGWSLSQTARRFLVTPATIASWNQRLDEEGPGALVQIREPVNRFPEFVRYIVRRLKVLCPTMGKVKLAQVLCRAGLHLSSGTVGRIVWEPLRPKPGTPQEATGRAAHAAPARRRQFAVAAVLGSSSRSSTSHVGSMSRSLN